MRPRSTADSWRSRRRSKGNGIGDIRAQYALREGWAHPNMGPFTKPVIHAALGAARSLNALQRRSLSAPRAPLTIAKVLDRNKSGLSTLKVPIGRASQGPN